MNINQALNIEYLHIHENQVEAKMNLTEFHSQSFGLLHGGITIAFGETIAGLSSSQIVAPDMVAVGQTITANHVKSKICNGFVIAKGRLIHQGRKSHVWVIDIMDENSVIISHVTVTNALLPKKQQ